MLIEAMAGAVTVSEVFALIPLAVTVIVTVPCHFAVANPLASTYTPPDEDCHWQLTRGVVVLSVFTPSAQNCCGTPNGTLGESGVMTM